VTTDVRDAWSDRPIVIDAETLASEIHRLLVVSDGADVPSLIHDAATGRFDRLAGSIEQAGTDPAAAVEHLAMFWSIVCSEGWARFDPARTASVGAGSYFLASQLDTARAWALACDAMPGASLSQGDAAAVRSMVPVLLLNGAEDPQDPPSNVAGAAREFPNSLELAVAGLGHTIGTRGCLPAVVGAFIAAGSVVGLDTSCVASMTPAPFVTP
jgi:pimeloyl-ACP methyl ester carboxylesterase